MTLRLPARENAAPEKIRLGPNSDTVLNDDSERFDMQNRS